VHESGVTAPATAMRILLIGSLPAIAELACMLLQLEYEVETHSNSESAVQAWSHGHCDAAVLSISRSCEPPFVSVTAFRKQRPHAPIVIVSDMTQVEDRVAGLDAGADVYITAPFDVAELRARLSVIARNSALRLPAEVRMGPLLLRTGDPTVTIGADRVDLPPRERALLEMFAVSDPNVLGKIAIAKRLGTGEPASDSAVEILVHRLRRRLAPYGMSIDALRGVGYRLQFATGARGGPHPNATLTASSQRESKQPDVPLNETLPQADPEHWNTQLLEFTNDAIIIWEMHGRGILYWNTAAERLYGYGRAEALGKITHNLLKTQLAEGVITTLERDLARYGVWIGELTHTTQTGRRVLVEGRLALMSQRNNRWLVLEVNRDITDRIAADSSRRAMEQQLEDLRAERGT
jgi:two-component system OmpR family response regulator